MFDGNVFIKDTCKNVAENGKVIGYEMQTHMQKQYVGDAEELSFDVEMCPEDVVLLHIYRE